MVVITIISAMVMTMVDDVAVIVMKTALTCACHFATSSAFVSLWFVVGPSR